MTNPPTSYTTSWDTTVFCAALWPNLQPALTGDLEDAPFVAVGTVKRQR